MTPREPCRLLVLGPTGQLGRELVRMLAPMGEVLPIDRGMLDLEKPDRVKERLSDLRPDVIVNAAAYTSVDKAESEPKEAHAVNALSPGILGEEAKRVGALLVHFSTDYVFDGKSASPYTEDDAPGPLNVYGASKLAGERAVQDVEGFHLILRTSWLYSMHGNNFVRTILRLADEREELRVVHDQIGCPTWVRWLAGATVHAVREAVRAGPGTLGGLYHVAGGGSGTWYELADAVLALRAEVDGSNTGVRLLGISTELYPTPATRPAYSALDCGKFADTFGFPITPWEEQLRSCMTALSTRR